MAEHGRLPDAVWLGSRRLAPGDFLLTAAWLLAQHEAAGCWPACAPLRTGSLALEHHLQGSWGWVVFPGFLAFTLGTFWGAERT